MPGPIKPSEIDKKTVIPESVFEVFNAYIAEAWDGSEAVLHQDVLVDRIVQVLGCERHTVFDKNYLGVEDAYRKAGWRVDYDKPGYNETYPATFTFRKKRKS